ncbi:hypothetical protein [Loktanella sp. 3ANDIMAR09]|uniref:hypothetical protein n=1 Tax=Loktanella sp. 3ANDIMAR09 TaxID=1225657 RepID=UPI0012EDAA93|nr:hypothetical protein [Loktanella sp. 3ANDIMAR09]
MDAGSSDLADGRIVTDVRDLEQSIRHALMTRPGSCPLSPERGLDLSAFRDRPSGVRHLFLGAAMRACLERDVPRVVVDSLTADFSGFEKVVVTIAWRPRADVAEAFVTTEVTIDV